MKDGNCVAIGWDKLGDLSTLEANKEFRERLQQLLTEKHPAKPSVIGRSRTQVFNFVTTVADGDIVLAADGGTVLGVGRVTGDYDYDGASDFPHRRPVQWLSLGEWRTPDPEGLSNTVHEIKQASNVLECERRVQGASGQKQQVTQVSPPGQVSGTGPSQKTPPRLAGVPGRIQAVLDRKGQVILYGPPGTGKTFWAERAALDLTAYWAFGEPFESLGDEEKGLVAGTDQGDGFVRACCFHPAYGYEDFIEGYRPEVLNGQVMFRL